MTSLILFGTFILLFLIRVPIGISLGIASFVTIIYNGTVSPSYLAQGLTTTTDSFPLMAVPLFILAGEIMGKGGVSRRLFDFVKMIVGNITGGIAIATVATCIVFAAISGSGPATVAAIGGMVIPMMVERGYDKKFATALVACAATIGVIIPPSIPMVIYGVSSSTSIGDLFLAGIIPGIVIGIVLMIYSYFYAKKNNYDQLTEKFTWYKLFNTFLNAFWALLIPVLILGGIYGGVFTPTEAAAVAVVYGLFISIFIYKELKPKQVYEVFVNASLTTGVILIITGSANAFGRILTIERIPDQISTLMTSVSDNKIIILLMITVFLLFVGTFMDTLAAIIILTPILYPIATELQVDPVHFGVIMVVNLAIGFITPPLGGNLFVAAGITGMPIWDIAKKVFPMFILMLIVLLLFVFNADINILMPGSN
ncbi:TRAP transporter large permease [Salibacterium halotolerans]|uniref:C4-dicarboxylate transporter, DctM subunit n=1 Tax=Salibacterium halotolerans TaxID=1884432 RepID=A0A1I5KXN9_9BACI|nr:TRAP transporter large permease [Salibacterium halotolerans]SFO89683.1 C4-dicarboxylate transporter, DctM subunit [Salibacterium halotolerans]